MNFEAVTARYVDVRLERKKEVLNAYHDAEGKTAPLKEEKAAKRLKISHVFLRNRSGPLIE